MSPGTSCTSYLDESDFHVIASKVQYKDWVLRYSAHPASWPDSYFLLWWQFTSVDYTDPARVVGLWDGRKHHVPAFASEEQVVRTAFLAAKLCEEHEAAEAFSYNGVRVFDPHKEVLVRQLPDKTCANCVHAQSTDPKCGLCCGPYSPVTRYERDKDEP